MIYDDNLNIYLMSKPKIENNGLKRGQKVFLNNIEYEISRVDNHVYPICLKDYGRYSGKLEDLKNERSK